MVMERIAQALEQQATMVQDGSMGSGNIEISNNSVPKQAKGSPRLEFALAYLRNNPGIETQTGAWLQDNIPMPSGVKISYRTWSKAKGMIE